MECTWGDELRPAARVTRVHGAIPPVVTVACVAVGILLAVIGESASDDARTQTAAEARRPDVTAYAPDGAAAHRKHVFDERRARFDAAHHGATGELTARR